MVEAGGRREAAMLPGEMRCGILLNGEMRCGILLKSSSFESLIVQDV